MQALIGLLGQVLLLVVKHWLETKAEKKAVQETALKEISNGLIERDSSKIVAAVNDYRNNK